MKQPLFVRLSALELEIARAQGKGYGAATIREEVSQVLAVLGRAPLIAIDVGANIGEYTTELRTKFASVEVHLFEPARENIGKLASRFTDEFKIRINPFALSDVSGGATLFADKPGSALSSLSKRSLDHHGIVFDHQEQVEVRRFDTYWNSELGGREIDIVKLDVEGHELDVLKGFGDALTVTRVVQFEFGGTNIDTRTYFRDFFRFFSGKGFVLFRITPYGPEHLDKYREIDECFLTTNFIAKNVRQF